MSTATMKQQEPEHFQVLEGLVHLTSQGSGPWVRLPALVAHTGLSHEDIAEVLADLVQRDLVRRADRLAAGWQATVKGKNVLRDVASSEADGPARRSVVMRWVLDAVINHQGIHLEPWPGQPEGISPVSFEERLGDIYALEALGALEIKKAHGYAMIGLKATDRGRALAAQRHLDLAQLLTGIASQSSHMTTTNNTITAQTIYNNGAMAAGRDVVQHTTISSDERAQILHRIQDVKKAAAADPDAANDARAVLDVVDELETTVATAHATREQVQHLATRLRDKWADALAAGAGAATAKGLGAALQACIQYL